MSQERRKKRQEKLNKLTLKFLNRAHLNSFGFIEKTGIQARRIIVVGEDFGVVNEIDYVEILPDQLSYLAKPIPFADQVNDNYWNNKKEKKPLYQEISDLILNTENWPFIFISCDTKVTNYIQSLYTLEQQIDFLKKLNSKKTEFWFCEEDDILEKNPLLSSYSESEDSRIFMGLNIVKRKRERYRGN